MPRGQYDRAAAKAKHETVDADIASDPLQALMEMRAEIARKDALIARYQALLKRNGLWLD